MKKIILFSLLPIVSACSSIGNTRLNLQTTREISSIECDNDYRIIQTGPSKFGTECLSDPVLSKIDYYHKALALNNINEPSRVGVLKAWSREFKESVHRSALEFESGTLNTNQVGAVYSRLLSKSPDSPVFCSEGFYPSIPEKVDWARNIIYICIKSTEYTQFLKIIKVPLFQKGKDSFEKICPPSHMPGRVGYDISLKQAYLICVSPRLVEKGFTTMPEVNCPDEFVFSKLFVTNLVQANTKTLNKKCIKREYEDLGLDQKFSPAP